MNSQSSETSSSGAESQGANREESSYSFDPSGNENEDVYGPPGVFDPSENMVEALYGPPEMLKSRGSRMGFGDDESEGFDPALNDMAILYGPPSMFFDSEDELEWSEGDEDAAGGEVDVGDSDAGRTAGSGEANA